MQTITLYVEESFLQTFKELISHYPKDKISIKEDYLAMELERRIQDIDTGKEKLTVYEDGMADMMDRLRQKYAHL
jgi:hypothetical protein